MDRIDLSKEEQSWVIQEHKKCKIQFKLIFWGAVVLTFALFSYELMKALNL